MSDMATGPAPTDAPRPGPRPTASCIVTNYNYVRFVEEAVESALAQTRPFDEIMVVDDGSTDDSMARLGTRYARHPVVRLLTQQNGGQASAFNTGFLASSGEILTFLDADDTYEAEYLESILDIYAREPAVDFVFSAYRRFGEESGEVRLWNHDRRLGMSVIETALRRVWLGGPTSTLSMRRGLVARILPIPDAQDWRLEADCCLVLGAGLAAASKYYLAKPVVRYRVHASNRWYRSAPDAFACYSHSLAVNRLLASLGRRFGYDKTRLAALACDEFRTIERPTSRELRRYLITLLCSNAQLSRKWKGGLTILRHYREGRRTSQARRS